MRTTSSTLSTPRRRLVQLIALSTLSLAAAGGARAADPAYPATQQRPVQDQFHGTTVSEDYRWLEDFEQAGFKDSVKPLILKQNAIRLLKLDQS